MYIWKVQKNTQNSKIESKFINPFQTVRVGEGGGRRLVGCVHSRELGSRASLCEIYPTGKLQWHFTSILDSLWLSFEAAFAVLKGLILWMRHLEDFL